MTWGVVRRTCSATLAAAAFAVSGVAIELEGPDVAQVTWNSQSLIGHDLDGDGRTDLAVLDNDRARIELLYQKKPDGAPRPLRRSGVERWRPVLEDAPFDRMRLATGIRTFALAAGDLDGDGLPDLAYTGVPDGLTIRYQGPADEFVRRRVIDIDRPASAPDTLVASDLDRDGLIDLAVMTDEAVLVFRQDPAGDLTGPRVYPVAGGRCFALQALDADLDGRTDLVYQVPQVEDSLRIRFGLRSGGFGPEQAFRTGPLRGAIATLSLENPSRVGFVAVHAATGLLQVLSFAADPSRDGWLRRRRPRFFAISNESADTASYAVDDLDGNSLPDIVIAEGRGARVWLILQKAPGEFSEATAYPSLSNVRSLAAADLDGDGRAELVMASATEATVAWTALAADDRLAYPSPLPTRGTPVAVAASDLDRDGTVEIAYAFDDRQERGVVVLDPDDSTEGWRETAVVLPSLSSPPRGLRVTDVDHDGRPDLVLFGTHEGMRLLLQAEDGTFTESSPVSGFRRGLLEGVAPSAFSTGDVDGDGFDEMLIASQGYARALRVATDGSLEIVDQYNARNADARVAVALVADLDGSRVPEIVLVEEGGERLEVLTRRRGGVYRHAEMAHLHRMELLEGRITDLTMNGRPDLLLLAGDFIVWLPVAGDDLELIGQASHESDLEDVSYQMVAAGEFDADGRDDIVAVDSRGSRVLEILTIQDGDTWKSLLQFTIFEVDPHYEGQRGGPEEPREVLVTDLSGDGHDDIALLIHDRVLVYRQR
jgi:hypothetical protein